METLLPANGVISRSRDAIVTFGSDDAGDLVNRTRQRNAGAARNSRRGPDRRGRRSAFGTVATGADLEILRADRLGLSPPSAGSLANGRRRLMGCGISLGRYSSSMTSRSRAAAGFSDAEGVKYTDNLLILFFGLPSHVVSEMSNQVGRNCYREGRKFSKIHRGIE